jgi:hypothetical protein
MKSLSRLSNLVSRFGTCLSLVDKNTATVTMGKHGAYLPGVQSMNEQVAVSEVVDYWRRLFPDDFHPRGECHVEVPYPMSPRSKADICFTTTNQFVDDSQLSLLQTQKFGWAVEVKRFQFVGDNGKNNDFGVAKTFSPYLKDRSLAHDAQRLCESGLAERTAVLMYGFEYNEESCMKAMTLHPNEAARIREILKVCKINSPSSPSINFDLLISRLNPNLEEVVSIVDYAEQKFPDLWRHPCGGELRIMAWEISRSN